MLTINECKTSEEILATFPVMNQLRTQLEKESYVELVQSLNETEGYCLVGLFDNEICTAVAGYRIRRRLFSNCNPEMYVDDLVTDDVHRGKGYGKMLLDYLKQECERLGYQGICLESGTHRVEAHKFYQREGMDITALHFYRSCQ